MKVLIIASLLIAGLAQADPYQSHGQDGNAYWVLQCSQPDECFENAYQWCDRGPYTGIDKGQAYLATGVFYQFRFVCKTPHKVAKIDAQNKCAGFDPEIVAAFPDKCRIH